MPTLMQITFIVHGVQKAKYKLKQLWILPDDLTLLLQICGLFDLE
jgi:hypothetical protein